MQCFEFGSVTVCCVVSAVNKATWNALKDEFLAFPFEEQQKNNSNQWEFFYNKKGFW